MYSINVLLMYYYVLLIYYSMCSGLFQKRLVIKAFIKH